MGVCFLKIRDLFAEFTLRSGDLSAGHFVVAGALKLHQLVFVESLLRFLVVVERRRAERMGLFFELVGAATSDFIYE